MTEDADIGLRLARFGFGVGCIESTTHEEAPATLRGFFNQRRRWCKGWYQTLTVLWRRPFRLLRQFGPVRCGVISLVVMSNVAGSLAAPLCVAGLAAAMALRQRALPAGVLGDGLIGLWIIVMLAGIPAVLAPCLIGMKRRRLWHLSPVLLLLPAYVTIICIAAWTAIFDLIRHPHYWHKTDHGAARRG